MLCHSLPATSSHRKTRVNDSLMVFPVAVQDINDLSINNLKAWMQVQNVPLGILANFYPASLEFMVLRV